MIHENKSLWQRITATVLAVILAVGMTPAIIASTGGTTTLNLVSFGDSMTNGLGLQGYEYGDPDITGAQVNGFRQNDATTTYPALLKAYFESAGGYDKVNWEQLAVSCMRPEDINFLLRFHTDDSAWKDLAKTLSTTSASVDNWNASVKAQWKSTFVDNGNVVGDYFTFNEFVNGRFHDWGKFEDDTNEGPYSTFLKDGTNPGFPWDSNPTLAQARYYQEAVKAADVITLGTGNSNFGVIMLQNIVGLFTGTAFSSGFRDAVPVDEVINARFDHDTAWALNHIISEVDAFVKSSIGGATGEDVAKAIQIVEYTVASFMISYIDMLDAIAELNETGDLDIIMMGLMNTMDGVKLDLGGFVLDFGALVDGITDILSTYFFTVPVIRQMMGDYEGITFYAVPNDDFVEVMAYEMTTVEDIEGNDVVFDRLRTSIIETIFGLLGYDEATQTALKSSITPAALAAYRLTVQNASTALTGANYSDAAISGTAAVLDDSYKALALYSALEHVIADCVTGATLKTDAIAALTDGSLASLFPDAATLSLTDDVLKAAVIAKKGYTTTSNKSGLATAMHDDLIRLSGIKMSATPGSDYANAEALETLLKSLSDTSNSKLVPTGTDWYSIPVTMTGTELSARLASLQDFDAVVNNFDKTNYPALVGVLNGLNLENLIYTNLSNNDTVKGLLCLFGRMIVGGGIGSHPSNNGHAALFAEIMEVYPNVPAELYISGLVAYVADAVKEYGPAILSEVYEYAKASGILPENTDEIAAFVYETVTALAAATSTKETIDVIKAAMMQIYLASGMSMKEIATYIIGAIVVIADTEEDQAVAWVRDILKKAFKAAGKDGIKFAVEFAASYLDEPYKSALIAKTDDITAAVAGLVYIHKEEIKDVANDLWTELRTNGTITDEALATAYGVLNKLKSVVDYLSIADEETVKDDVLDLIDTYGPSILAGLYDYAVGAGVIPADTADIALYIENAVEAIANAENGDELVAIIDTVVTDVTAALEAKGISFTFAEIEAFVGAAAGYIADANPEKVVKDLAEAAESFIATYGKEGILFLAGYAATFFEEEYRQTFLEVMDYMADEILTLIADNEENITEGAWAIAQEIFNAYKDQGYFNDTDIAFTRGHLEGIKKLAGVIEECCKAGVPEAVVAYVTTIVESATFQEIVAELESGISVEEIVKARLEAAAALLDAYLQEKVAEEAQIQLAAFEAYLVANTFLTADDVTAIEALIAEAVAALADGDEDAALAACDEIVSLIFAEAVANGLVPNEVLVAINAAIEIINAVETAGSIEELLVSVAAQVEDLVAVYGPAALEAIKDYLVSSGYVTAEQLAAIDAYIAECIENPEAAVAAVVALAYEAGLEAGLYTEEDVAAVYAYAEQIIAVVTAVLNGDMTLEELNELLEAWYAAFADQYVDPTSVAFQTYLAYASRIIKIATTTTEEDVKAQLDAIIEEAKSTFEILVFLATHGFYTYNEEGVLVVLGGDTASAKNLGREDLRFFDIIQEYYGIDTVKNLGQSKILPWELYDYVIKNIGTIASADFITYEIDSASYIYAILSGDVEWINYADEFHVELIEEAIDLLKQLILGDFTNAITLDPAALAAEIRVDAEQAIYDAIASTGINVNADVKAKIDEAVAATAAWLESLTGCISDEVYVAIDLLVEVLAADWSKFGEITVDDVVTILKDEVLKLYAEKLQTTVEALDAETAAEFIAAVDACLDFACSIVDALKPVSIYAYDYVTTYKVQLTAIVNKIDEFLVWTEWLDEDAIAFMGDVAAIAYKILSADWTKIEDLDAAAIVADVKATVLDLVWAEFGDEITSLTALCKDQVEAIIDYILNYVTEVLTAQQALKEECIAKIADFLAAAGVVLDLDNLLATADAFVESVIDSIGDKFEADVEARIAEAVAFLNAELTKAEALKREYIGYPDEETVDLVLEVAEKFLYATVAGAVNTAKAAAAIREVNAEAPIAVIGMYNPIQGLSVKSGDTTIDLGAFADYLVAASDMLYTVLALENDFTYVAVPETETDGFDTVIDLDVVDLSAIALILLGANDKMLANAEGHAYIAEKIIEAIYMIYDCDHMWVTLYNEEGHWHYCSLCFEVTDIEEHVYDDEHDLYCNECGYKRVILGDFNADGYVDKDDAVYLLFNAQFPDDSDYKLNQNGDYDEDDKVTHKDAVYLLYHTFYGEEEYPLVKDDTIAD